MDTTIAKLRGTQRVLLSPGFLFQHITMFVATAGTSVYGGLGFLAPVPGELPGAVVGGVLGLVIGNIANIWLALRSLKADRILRALELTPHGFPLRRIAEEIYGANVHPGAFRTKADRRIAGSSLKRYIHLFSVAALDYSSRVVQLRDAVDSRQILTDSLLAQGETPNEGVMNALDIYRYWLQDVAGFGDNRIGFHLAKTDAERSVAALSQVLGVKPAASWRKKALS